MTTPADVMKMAKENGVKIVDFRFCDLLGTWQHTSKSISDVDEEIFEHGVGFDGSSIRGFQSIDASDMLMMPDPTTARLDPYTAVPTMYVVCDLYDPTNRKRYDRDPRGIAQTGHAFRRLIDIAIQHGGSYFLTYHRHATAAQLQTCYPQFPEFLAEKRRLDPDGVFQSEWYRWYGEGA